MSSNRHLVAPINPMLENYALNICVPVYAAAFEVS